jgi:hypothetical protein
VKSKVTRPSPELAVRLEDWQSKRVAAEKNFILASDTYAPGASPNHIGTPP